MALSEKDSGRQSNVVDAPKCTRTQISLSGEKRRSEPQAKLVGCLLLAFLLLGQLSAKQQPALNLRINAHNFISIHESFSQRCLPACLPACLRRCCLSFWHMKRLPTWRVIIIFQTTHVCVRVVGKFLTNVYRTPQGVPGTQRQPSVERLLSDCWSFVQLLPALRRCLCMLKLKLNSAPTHTHTHTHMDLAAPARMRNPFACAKLFGKVFVAKLLMMKMREKRKPK